jgi:hypothetical protein
MTANFTGTRAGIRQERRDQPLPPGPENQRSLLAKRVLVHKRTLNDLVEDILVQLWEDNDFRRYTRAVWDEQAIEGSLAADNIMAATMIRERARENDNNEVANEKLATIAKAMGVVLRRYEESRQERRNRLHGENVPGNNGD